MTQGILTVRTLTIHRAGDIPLRVVGDTHCGAKAAGKPVGKCDLGDIYEVPVKYEAMVVCAPTLDARGFLFDQVMLDAWMQSWSREPITLSCEALVITMANRLQDHMARKVSHCDLRTITLSISPNPYLAKVQVHLSRHV